MTCTAIDCQDTACAEHCDGKIASKVFLFLADPQATLDSGYDRIAIERSKSGSSGSFTRITKPNEMLVIRSTQNNYVFSTRAEPTWFFRAVLVDSTGNLAHPDINQPATPAEDTYFEGAMTVDEMKAIYLPGVDLIDNRGRCFADEMFVHGIKQALAFVEDYLSLRLLPTSIKGERQDLRYGDFFQWGFIRTRQKPIISVDDMEIIFPSGGKMTVPKDALVVDRTGGLIRIVPSHTALKFQGDLAGAFTGPFLYMDRGLDYIPGALSITYQAGFELGERTPSHEFGLPASIKEVVGKLASFGPLNVAGDLIGGGPFTSKSISMDGLSQTVALRASAVSSGYGARLTQYSKELKIALDVLRQAHTGPLLASV